MGNDCKIIIISGINWQNKKGGLNVQYNNYSIVKSLLTSGFYLYEMKQLSHP